MRTNFVVFSPFNYMNRFLETYKKAKGEKPRSAFFDNRVQKDFRGLDVEIDGGQVIADKFALPVATEILKELKSRPLKDVIVDGNRLLGAIRFLAKRSSDQITDEMKERLYIVVESVHSGPLVTHDLSFAEEFAYA